MHIVTLSFDDGFRQSNLRIADLYERHGLSACFNIVSHAAEPWWTPPNEYQPRQTLGDWGLWRELVARGHEVMPHSERHESFDQLSFEDGKAAIQRCLDRFAEELSGFDARTSVFNFPYNRTTPQLEAWLPTVVRAFRGGGVEHGLNPLPSRERVALRTTGQGPANCEAHLDACIDALLRGPEGWLVYNTHGLDDEGWGPISADYLARLLDRLAAMPNVRVLPAAQALAEAG